MKSLAELQAIKDKMKDKVVLREGTNEVRVVVGMATCGISAGARPVLNAFVEAVNEGGLSDKVTVSQTGCVGLCQLEPIVEVYEAGKDKVGKKGVVRDPAVHKEVLDDLTKAGVYPIVYAFVEDIEKFSYVQALNTKEQQEFLDTRKNDVRDNPVEQASDLYKGEIFYLTCIGDYEKLAPFYEKYKDIYHCVFQEDIYLHSQWLEIMPKDASKANAIRQLKEFLGCERVVAFGDGINDVDMFLLADEAYAVENACDELKAYATGVIGSNNEDAVAKFLLNRLSGEKKK